MNAFPAQDGDKTPSTGDASLARIAPSPADQALGLQLCRAGFVSLTRLQLALDRGDRSRAMEMVDDLHALDIRIERVVEALPAPSSDARLTAAARRLQDGKMALAFERLALASGVSGPALAPRTPPQGAAAGPSRDIEPAPAADWPPAEPPVARRWPDHALRGAILLAVVAGTAAALAVAL